MSSKVDKGGDKKAAVALETLSSKELLLIIWKALISAKGESEEEDKKREEGSRRQLTWCFDQFLDICGVDALKTGFRENIPANSDRFLYPWDQASYTPEGKEWIRRLSAASLQLPDFVEKEETNPETYPTKVKEEIKSKVTGEQIWDLIYDTAFEEAKGGALQLH